MKRMFFTITMAACCLIATGRFANAISVYSATATMILSLSTSSAGGLDDLTYLGSTVVYDAKAVATKDGSFKVDAVFDIVPKSGTGTTFGNAGSLSDLFLKTKDGRRFFPNVLATRGGAKAEGKNENISAGNTARFQASVKGEANDAVEDGTSSVRWDAQIIFQNTSSDALSVFWTVSYLFTNSASADPKGSAASTGGVKVRRGTATNSGGTVFEPTTFTDGNAACDPVDSTCNFGPTPSPAGTTKIFEFVLAPNQIGVFNAAVRASGFAAVVPLPTALPLFGTGLLIMGFVGWRKRKQAKS